MAENYALTVRDLIAAGETEIAAYCPACGHRWRAPIDFVMLLDSPISSIAPLLECTECGNARIVVDVPPQIGRNRH